MNPASTPDQERQQAVACRKFFLIGIATIVIYTAFYAYLKSYSDSKTKLQRQQNQEIRVQSSWVDPANVNPWLTGLTQPMFFLFIYFSIIVFVPFCVCIACAACVTVEAERELQELRRDTKSDMNLAIPKALP